MGKSKRRQKASTAKARRKSADYLKGGGKSKYALKLERRRKEALEA